jgi:hypothetical protein
MTRVPFYWRRPGGSDHSERANPSRPGKSVASVTFILKSAAARAALCLRGITYRLTLTSGRTGNVCSSDRFSRKVRDTSATARNTPCCIVSRSFSRKGFTGHTDGRNLPRATVRRPPYRPPSVSCLPRGGQPLRRTKPPSRRDTLLGRWPRLPNPLGAAATRATEQSEQPHRASMSNRVVALARHGAA